MPLIVFPPMWRIVSLFAPRSVQAFEEAQEGHGTEVIHASIHAPLCLQQKQLLAEPHDVGCTEIRTYDPFVEPIQSIAEETQTT